MPEAVSYQTGEKLIYINGLDNHIRADGNLEIRALVGDVTVLTQVLPCLCWARILIPISLCQASTIITSLVGVFFDVEGHIVLFKKTFAPAESFQNGCLADFFSFFVGGVL